MKCLIYIGIFYLSILDFYSQNNWRKAIPISIDGGLQLAKISKDSLSTWNNNLVKSFHLQSGISTLYRKRVGLLLQGGFILHGQNFFAGKNVYSIETLMLSLNCTPYVLFPVKKNEATNLHLGFGLGYSFNNSDILVKQTFDFKAVSTSIRVTAPTFAPEIGITRIEDKLAISLLATYFYQNGINKVSTTTITDNNGKYTSTIKGDYLGFKIRMEFKIGKEKVYPNIYKQTPPEDDAYVKRANSIIRNYITRKDFIVLEFFESNKVDHDSISVCVNGKYILVNHGLTNEKVSIRVPLEKGVNTITVYALNEGDIPPNTATCLIHFGNRKEEFPVQTGHKKNASIEIERK